MITSRDNPRVRRWRALAREPRLRRAERRALIEGENLIAACLDAGHRLEALIAGAAGRAQLESPRLRGRLACAPTLVSDAVFATIAEARTPAGLAAEIAIPAATPDPARSAGCVMLEDVQDAGNVGAILRSAAAFGVRDALLGPGCADPWSPKVLRAAAGAHFSLAIAQEADLARAVRAFGGTVACTVPRGGTPLGEAGLGGRIAWLFGSEGRGVSPALAALAGLRITIPTAGGVESLNVAAAAAVCLYAAARVSTRAASGSARA